MTQARRCHTDVRAQFGSVRRSSVGSYLDDDEQPFRDGHFDTGDIGYLTAENFWR